MAKTQEELNALKEEVETVRGKLHELTEEELAQVTGGGASDIITFRSATYNGENLLYPGHSSTSSEEHPA